ncbi:hypothetical protein HID58_061688, partial [Brassica napus]
VSNPFGMKVKDFHLQSDPPSQSLDGNIGDGLAIGESQMSPEIFEALSARGIQKLFPIHIHVIDRIKKVYSKHAWEELFFCLVLAPTRELSGYVEKEFREALSLGDALNKILSNCLDTSTAGADTCQWNAASAICSLSK